MIHQNIISKFKFHNHEKKGATLNIFVANSFFLKNDFSFR